MNAIVRRSAAVEVWKPERGRFQDLVVIEEPLEIRVDGLPIAVTLRTPGDDRELAAGFVLTEGLVSRPEDLDQIDHVDDVPPEARGNVVDVRLTPSAGRRHRGSRSRARRPDFITAACGVCGRGTIDAVRRRAPALINGTPVPLSIIAGLPDQLRRAQPVFDQTGGLHGAGLFDAGGRLIVAREDVGRHNAVDKIIGHAALQGGETTLPLCHTVLLVSGRAGFEIVLKAWIAGIPVVASVSAPSQLAIDLAEEAGMTLLGFVRGTSFTAYAGRERLDTATAEGPHDSRQ